MSRVGGRARDCRANHGHHGGVRAGEHDGVFLDELGELGDGDLGEVEGKGLDEFEEFRQRGAAARRQHGAGALERLLGRERGKHRNQIGRLGVEFSANGLVTCAGNRSGQRGL